MLTKNYFLAKLVCLFGLHRYILFSKPRQMSMKEIKEMQASLNKDCVLDRWRLDKKVKDQLNEKDTDKFIEHSFRRNFRLNGREIELFEPPKILGDIFESVIGAVFLDGGIQKVIDVYQHLLSPFIVFTAKYSKKLFKEHKEDFNSSAHLLMIKPTMRCIEIEIPSLTNFTRSLKTQVDPSQDYIIPIMMT